MNNKKPFPNGFYSVIPNIKMKDSSKAIEFYKKAFNAEELGEIPSPDGNGEQHAAIKVGDSVVIMKDEIQNHTCANSQSPKISPVNLLVYVDDVDAVYHQAVNSGFEVTRELDNMICGDRCATIKDPYGYSWTIATRVKDLTNEEMQEASRSFFADMENR